MKEISSIEELLGESYLKKFKVIHPQLLFSPYWENLKIDRCPLCGNKLKFPYKKTIALCNGKKHHPFTIKLDRLNQIKGTDYEAIRKRNPWA